jgi:hypothetical protein
MSGSPPHTPARPRIIFRCASSSSSSTPYIRKRTLTASAKPRGKDRDHTSWRLVGFHGIPFARQDGSRESLQLSARVISCHSTCVDCASKSRGASQSFIVLLWLVRRDLIYFSRHVTPLDTAIGSRSSRASTRSYFLAARSLDQGVLEIGDSVLLR